MHHPLPHNDAVLQHLMLTAQDVFRRAALVERNWLVYELRQRHGKKPSKLPIKRRAGGSWHVDDKSAAAEWTLEEALNFAEQNEKWGIGYLPRAGSALVGVDIDGVVGEDGNISDWADNAIGNAYTEFSPSGTGLRCLLPRKKGDDWFREPGGSNPLGFFGSDGRFFTVTFNSIWEAEDTFIEDDGVLRAEIDKHLGSVAKDRGLSRASKMAKRAQTRSHWFLKMSRPEQIGCMVEVLRHFDPEPDETWYRVGMALKTLDVDWAWGLFDAWSQEAPNYDLAGNETRWQSFKSDGDLTFRSLFKEARDDGWDEGTWRDPVQFDEIDGTLFKEFAPSRLEPEQPWLLEGWLRQHGNAGFAGMSGVGKTTLTGTWIAAMIAGRTDLVGLPPVGRPLNVAWINAEEEAATLQHQVAAALAEMGLEAEGRLLIAGTEALNSSPDGLSLVVKKRNVTEHYTDLVVNEALVDQMVSEMTGMDVAFFDPVTEFNDGNENDRGDAKKLNRAITLISQRSGAASVVWSHTGQMPDGKKPNWYRDDLYAQRGSSQNVGALKTFGTLSPILPVGITKSEDARRWYASVKKGENPNVIELKQLKVKNYPTLTSLFYRLVPSKANRDYAVAQLIESEDAAQVLVNGTFDAGRSIALMAMTKKMVQMLGEGDHTSYAVNKAMGDVAGWPAKRVRLTTPKHRDFVDQWQNGVVVSVDKQEWKVLTESDGKDEFKVLVTTC